MSDTVFFLLALGLLSAGYSLLTSILGPGLHNEPVLGPLVVASTLAILRAIERSREP